MPRRAVVQALKDRIPYLKYVEQFSVKEICRILDVKKTLVYDTLSNFRQHGVTYNPNAYKYHYGGGVRKLATDDVQLIRRLLKENPCLYLDELQDDLLTKHGMRISISTIFRTLRRLYLSRKTVTAEALERNDLDRWAFMNRIAEVVTDPAQLMFTDEAARNKKTSMRKSGWSLIGHRCRQRRFFVRGQRYSIIPVLTMDGIIAHDIVAGSVTSDRFVDFLREHVIPLTNPYPGPRSVLVLDNCNIHHSEAVQQLVEDEAACKLIFLPPYSPDLNPIEQAFSAIKAFLRRNWKDDSLSIMDRACHDISPSMAWGFFRSSGYVV